MVQKKEQRKSVVSVSDIPSVFGKFALAYVLLITRYFI